MLFWGKSQIVITSKAEKAPNIGAFLCAIFLTFLIYQRLMLIFASIGAFFHAQQAWLVAKSA